MRPRSYPADRYGRNLRRLAREQKQGEAQLVAVSRDAHREANRCERLLREMLERLKRALGGESAVLPIEIAAIVQSRPSDPRYDRTAASPREWPMPAYMDVDILDNSFGMVVQQLHHLLTYVEYRPEHLSYLVRWVDRRDYSDRLPEMSVVWSADALSRIGHTRGDVEFLAQDIARQMVAERERMRSAA